MYKILKNTIEMDDYSVQKLSNLQPPEPFEWNTVEGTELNVSDCIGGKGKIEVKGNTEQKQLSGKNLFGISDYEKTYNGVQIKIKDGEITLNGTCTGTGTVYIRPRDEQILNGTYTISRNSISGTMSGSGNINLRNVSDDSIISGTQMSLTISSRTFTLENANVEYGIYLMRDATFDNYKFRPQLVEGDTPDYDFEPYCGGQEAPNPSYEIPIKVVTGDNVVKHVGKNLLNFDKASSSGSGLTAVIEGTNLKINGTSTSTSKTITDYLPNIYKAGTYVFSITKVIGRALILRFFDDNNETIRSVSIPSNGTSASFTLDGTEKKYRLIFNPANGETYDINIDLQLEEGTTPTQYEPCIEEEYELELWKENEFDSENASVIEALLKGSNATLISNSHERTIIIPCKKNVTYKISKREGSRLRVAEFDEEPQIDSTGRNIKINDYGTELIYSTTTGSYLAIGFYFTDTDSKICTIEEMLATIKIQEAIELCKIGDYEDILFKNEAGDENYNAELEDGAWYKKSAIAEVVLDGRETWNYNSGNRYFFTNKFLDNYVTQYTKLVSNNYIGGMASNGGLYNNHIQTGTAYSFMICDNRFTDKNDLKTWLSTHNTIVKYPLATPIYEKITNPTLISQLEALKKAKWFKGINHWWTETNNLEPVLKGTYRQAINE